MQDEIKQLNGIEVSLLDDDVIQLHAIARRVEQLIGKGQLSEDLRHTADKLSALLKRY